MYFNFTIPGWPKKNGTVDFLGLCSDQQLSFFTLLDRPSFPHYNNTKIIKFGWELFILWVISYRLSFSGFAIHLSLIVSRKSGQIPKMTVHQKLLMEWKVLNQIWWSWCYYNEEKMLYPARWKKITVDQSKVLKNWLYRLFRVFFGPPGIQSSLMTKRNWKSQLSAHNWELCK